MTGSILDGISAKTINTNRISTRVLFAGPEDGVPVLFLHGNTSSATWWEETMLSLPEGFKGISPDQRGFGEAYNDKKIDATRGLSDLSDDVLALLDHLGIEKCHLVGSSLGGNVAYTLMISAPDKWLSVTLVAPGSPYGFGGTKGIGGEKIYDDYAGSGGGLTNPELIRLMAEKDTSLDSQFSPRNALRALVFMAGIIPDREDALVEAMLTTHLGEQDVPGDKVLSPNWPGIAPGKYGPANALSPKYGINVSELYELDPKPPILWIRGSHDISVSNSAMADPGTLGKMGLLPGWPGEEVYPAQPMLDQTRTVLEKYAETNGSFREEVIQDTAHVPYIDNLAAFNAVFHPILNN